MNTVQSKHAGPSGITLPVGARSPITRNLSAAIEAEREKVAAAIAHGAQVSATADRLDAASLALLADIEAAYAAIAMEVLV